MLENEPDTDQQPSTGDQVTPPAAAPRRRRAASRPAGPPATAADAPAIEKAPASAELDQPPVDAPTPVASQVETGAPEQSQSEVVGAVSESQPEVAAPLVTAETQPAPVKKAAAKRAPRKTAAKTTPPATEADQASAATEPPAADGDTPKKRAPRKRAAKKVAATDDGPRTDTTTVASDADVAAPAGWEAPSESTADAAAATEEHTDPSISPGEVAVEETDATAETPEAVTTDDGQAEQPRDFRWLADPFAVPAPPADVVADPLALGQAPTEQSAPEQAVDDDEDATDEDAPDVEDDATDVEDEADEDETGDGSNRRRRRRRGGRRRRRSGGGDAEAKDTGDSEEETSGPSDQHQDSAQRTPAGDAPAAESAEDESAKESGHDADGEDSEGQGRRRRRRRRRGEEAAALPDDPTDVVVRVREPRPRKKASSNNEITGIEGSTRMEAKRQRRKDGRDAGRRRAPILSEAEFLARRESVNRQMIIRQREDLTQIAVLEDGILVEHYVDRESAASLIGNVYLGRVQNVLPSMEAAFIDIGRGRNAVLYAGEVDWDSFGAEGHNRKVEKVLKSGQMILVQVSKDPVGAKGARLTNHVSIPGRYIVYAPGGHLSGISRKLPDVERRRLKDILADLVGESASVIVRTAAEGASEEELVRDVNRLKAQWEDIERKVKAGNSPQLLYGEPDLTVRIVRDLFTEDFSELIVSGNGSMNDAYDAIQGYVTHVAPHLQDRIHRWEQTGDVDLFAEYRLDEQIAKALERKVFLPSGGSLVIDRTEAMTVIDVNTGKFTGTGGNLEATVTSNNLEAAEEIVNQLRLRDIGGIIVIDFIDMVLPNNRELLLRRLVECLGRDRTRHQVAEVTSLGLVQMTRKKIGTGLLEAFGTECPVCHGRGYELHDLPVDTQKQADGGTREQQRPRDHRPRPGDGGRGGNGSRGSNGGRGTPAEHEKPAEHQPAEHVPTERVPNEHVPTEHVPTEPELNAPAVTETVAEPVANGQVAQHNDSVHDTPYDDHSDRAPQPDRSRSRRGRRGGRGDSANREHESTPESQPAPTS